MQRRGCLKYCSAMYKLLFILVKAHRDAFPNDKQVLYCRVLYWVSRLRYSRSTRSRSSVAQVVCTPALPVYLFLFLIDETLHESGTLHAGAPAGDLR